MRRLPVESSRTSLSRKSVMPSSSSSRSTFAVDVVLGVAHRRQAQRGRERIAQLEVAFERDARSSRRP